MNPLAIVPTASTLLRLTATNGLSLSRASR